MSQKSKIQWTDWTANPIRAERISDSKRGWFCTHFHAGCTFCYAETWNKRFGTGLAFTAQNEKLIRPVLIEKELTSWKKIPVGSKVFICDMSDLFHDLIPDEMIFQVFRAMAHNPHLIFQVLTKRIARAADVMPKIRGCLPDRLNHVWIGTSVSDQKTADENLPYLLRVPSRIRFISYEPILGPLDLTEAMYGKEDRGMNCFGFTDGFGYEAAIQWIIAGCESGNRRRRCEISWIESVQEQCEAADVPLFIKQVEVDGKVTGDISKFPHRLRVRNYPLLTNRKRI